LCLRFFNWVRHKIPPKKQKPIASNLYWRWVMSADYYRISRSALLPRQKTQRYNNKNNMRTSGDRPTSCWDHRVRAEKLSIPPVCFLN
jgi:hypothetical protein